MICVQLFTKKIQLHIRTEPDTKPLKQFSGLLKRILIYLYNICTEMTTQI